MPARPYLPPCCSFVPVCCLVLYILLNLVNKARLRTFSVFVVSALAASPLLDAMLCACAAVPHCSPRLPITPPRPTAPPPVLPPPAQVLPRPVVLQLASKEIKLRLDDEVRGL